MSTSDETFMLRALELAHEAETNGEVPVGAVIVCHDEIIAEGYNRPITSHDPCAHAEIIALRNAGQHQQNYRLPECTMYVTLEPCCMCAGAIIHARLKRLVFGATDPKAGAAGSVFNLLDSTALNHRVGVKAGILEQESASMLTTFFQSRRK